MDTIVISAGAKEGAFIDDDGGAFPATLVTFERKGPFISKQDGKEFHLYEWGFAIEDQPADACMVWAASGESTGPKSKTFGYISALFGGKQPPVGTKLNKNQLIGREALVTVHRDPDGYMKVDSVTPLPKAMQKGKPAPAPVAEADDETLPF